MPEIPGATALRLLNHLIQRMERYDQPRLDAYWRRLRRREIDPPCSRECFSLFSVVGMLLLFVGGAMWTATNTFKTTGCLGGAGELMKFSCSNMNRTWEPLCDNSTTLSCMLDCSRFEGENECVSGLNVLIAGGVILGLPLLCLFLTCLSALYVSLRNRCDREPSLGRLSSVYSPSSEEIRSAAIFFHSQLTQLSVPSYSHPINLESDIQTDIQKLLSLRLEDLQRMRATWTADGSVVGPLSEHDSVLVPLLGS